MKHLPKGLPAEVVQRLSESALVESGLVRTVRGEAAESRARFEGIEIRTNDDGTLHVAGYATTWGTEYDLYGGPERGGWTESVESGAASKALAENDDVRFLVNHEGLPLARTKSKTLTLEQDEMGLRMEADLDPGNPTVVELVSALRRGDVDQMSFAFTVVRQEWNDDYTRRVIREVRLFDVAAVTYPANPATIIGVRADTPAGEPAEDTPERGFSLALAQAEAQALSI